MEYRGEILPFKPLIEAALAALPDDFFVDLSGVRGLAPEERRGVGAFLFYSGVSLADLSSLLRRAARPTRLPETEMAATDDRSTVLLAVFRAAFCEDKECDTPLGTALLRFSDPNSLLRRPLPRTYLAPFFSPAQSIRVQNIILAGLALHFRGLLSRDFPPPSPLPSPEGRFYFLSPLSGREEKAIGSLEGEDFLEETGRRFSLPPGLVLFFSPLSPGRVTVLPEREYVTIPLRSGVLSGLVVSQGIEDGFYRYDAPKGRGGFETFYPGEPIEEETARELLGEVVLLLLESRKEGPVLSCSRVEVLRYRSGYLKVSDWRGEKRWVNRRVVFGTCPPESSRPVKVREESEEEES